MRTTTAVVKSTTRTGYRSTLDQGFVPEDGSIPLRLVGTNEYTHAIDRLDRLVTQSSLAEIDVYNRILARQPEFSFFTRLSLDAPRDGAVDVGQRYGPSDAGFQKSSLDWLMALARIELAATLSMYSETGNAFDFLAPGQYGQEAYMALLVEDAASHLNALETDPELKDATKLTSDTDSETWAYVRRLKLVNDMLQMASTVNDPRISEQSGPYLIRLKKLGRQLEQKIELATIRARNNGEVQSTEVREQNRSQKIPGTYRSLSMITRACQVRFLRDYGAK